ncbi:hypothetical protein [Paenibacillus soyae]|uniref:Uncharacterized protein n=1 Tax=Paenibacillus soyae TaxID=2969249 RepID=A0A9X2MPQ3_9BACL|nr:hypothetical protein [Paenibacillus soyae]MCR2805948.1 hypothetical protein [Paenibacillus soyae]
MNFSTIWNWQIEPLPILISLLVYFLPVIWREKRSDAYTPLYFSIYPLAKLNVPLSRYLGKSYLYDYFDEEDAEKEKKVMKIKSVYSAIIFVVVTPVFISVIWTLYLTEKQFYIVAAFVLLSILYRFIKSTYFFNHYTYIPRRKLIGTFYFLILLIFSYILIRSHLWISPLLQKKEYLKILTSAGDFILINIVINILLVAIIIPTLISIVFNKDERKKNLEGTNAYKQVGASYDSEIINENKYF